MSLEKKYLDLNFDDREKSVLLDTLYDVVYGKTGIPVKSLISFNKEDIINKLNSKEIGIIDDKFFSNNIIFLMSFALVSCFTIIVGKLKWFELVKSYYEVEYKNQEK